MTEFILIRVWTCNGKLHANNYGRYTSLEEADKALDNFWERIDKKGFKVKKVNIDRYEYSNETLGIEGFMEIQSISSPSDVVLR